MQTLRKTTLLFSFLALVALSACKPKDIFDAQKATFDINKLYDVAWIAPAPNASMPFLAQFVFKNDGSATYTEADGDVDYLLYTVDGKQIKLYEMDDKTMEKEDLEAVFEVVSISSDDLQLKAVGTTRLDLDDALKAALNKDNVLNLVPADKVKRAESNTQMDKVVSADDVAFDAGKSTVSNIIELFSDWSLTNVELAGKTVPVRNPNKTFTFDDKGVFTMTEGLEKDTDRYILKGDQIITFDADDLEIDDVYQITKLTSDELQLKYIIVDKAKADKGELMMDGALLNFKKK